MVTNWKIKNKKDPPLSTSQSLNLQIHSHTWQEKPKRKSKRNLIFLLVLVLVPQLIRLVGWKFQTLNRERIKSAKTTLILVHQPVVTDKKKNKVNKTKTSIMFFVFLHQITLHIKLTCEPPCFFFFFLGFGRWLLWILQRKRERKWKKKESAIFWWWR